MNFYADIFLKEKWHQIQILTKSTNPKCRSRQTYLQNVWLLIGNINIPWHEWRLEFNDIRTRLLAIAVWFAMIRIIDNMLYIIILYVIQETSFIIRFIFELDYWLQNTLRQIYWTVPRSHKFNKSKKGFMLLSNEISEEQCMFQCP